MDSPLRVRRFSRGSASHSPRRNEPSAGERVSFCRDTLREVYAARRGFVIESADDGKSRQLEGDEGEKEKKGGRRSVREDTRLLNRQRERRPVEAPEVEKIRAAAGTTTVQGSWTGNPSAARIRIHRLQLFSTRSLIWPELMAFLSWGLSGRPAWWRASWMTTMAACSSE